MSKEAFGFDLLEQQLAERTAEEVRDSVDYAQGDSEIEKLFYLALVQYVARGFCEYRDVHTSFYDALHRARVFDSEDGRLSLILDRQVQLFEDWRVDFVIHAYDWGTRAGRKQGWRKLVVECDGHDFHERTKQQAAKDRARDRRAQASDDCKIFRFTGSELWRDPIGCVQQVIDWATDGWP